MAFGNAILGHDISTEFSRVWQTYLNFESFSRSKGNNLSDFLLEWTEKMNRAQTAGCQYSDILLACKILDKANLNNTEVQEVINYIGNSTQEFLSLILSRLEHLSSLSLEREDDNQNFNKLEEEDVSLVKQEYSEAPKSESRSQLSPNNQISVITKNKGRSKPASSKCSYCGNDQNGISNGTSLEVTNGRTSCINCKSKKTNPPFNLEDNLINPEPEEEIYPDVEIKEEVPFWDFPEIDLNEGIQPSSKKSKKRLKKGGHEVPRQKKSISKHRSKKKTSVPLEDQEKEPDHEKKKLWKTWRKPTTCEICGKTFVRPYNLSLHMVTHTNERNFKCEFCPATYRHLTNLDYHKIQHMGERSVKCPKCPKLFFAVADQKKHLRKVHPEEFRFQCDQCSYKTNDKGRSVRHAMSHSGIHPYKCNMCSKTYRDKQSVKRHLNAYHKMGDDDEEKVTECIGENRGPIV